MENRQVPSDANGVYSLPSGYLAITGETIQASQHNPPLEDLESAMSARLMRSGVAPMTGALKIVDGSVGSPAIKFNSDGTSGFYKTTNGIGVSISGENVAEFTSFGASRMRGELIPWTLLSAPAGWFFPYGQTLSRTTYADFWTIVQAEIAAGNTFYNNGDGTTTFGIGDMRGRVVAGKDNMGGSAASRISLATSGINGSVLGAAGGEQAHTNTAAEMPIHAHNGTTGGMNSNFSHAHAGGNVAYRNGSAGADFQVLVTVGTGGSVPYALPNTSGTDTSHTHDFVSNNTGGGAAHNNTQPTLICNYILYVGA